MLKRVKVEQLLLIHQEVVFKYLQLTFADLFMMGCQTLLSELELAAACI
jgi:hypothetical protein